MYDEVTVYCRDAVSLITKFTNDEVQSYTATGDICLSLSKTNINYPISAVVARRELKLPLKEILLLRLKQKSRFLLI